jgi:hypothetical protein
VRAKALRESSARARHGGLIIGVAVLAAVIISAVAFVAGRISAPRSHDASKALPTLREAPSRSEATEETRRARARSVPSRDPLPNQDSGIATPSKTSHESASRAVLTDIQARLSSRARQNLPVEAQANNLADYLRGVVTAIRAIDPAIFSTLRAAYEEQICGSEPPPDIDLLLYAKLVGLEANMASPRALDCALERRQSEDVVVWSILDAWNASGRPEIPALDSIRRRAVDDRTKLRLLSPDEQRARFPPPSPVQARGDGGGPDRSNSTRGRGPAQL